MDRRWCLPSSWYCRWVNHSTGLSTTLVPNNKKNINYVSESNSTSLYILNEPVIQNGIVNITGKFGAGTIDVYLLVKSGNSYVVSDRTTKSVTDGWNDISTDFYLTGDGSEFIGIIGTTYFNPTGGVGFAEVATADRNATKFSSNSITNDYDLAVFPTFENITLSKKVNELENKTDNLLTDTNIVGFGNGVKDFSQYHNVGAGGKTYVSNEVLSKGNVFVHIAGIAQNGTIYILERNGNSFTVKKSKSVTLSEGENIVDMEYSTSGNGLEYIGYLAIVYYKESGGNGFWETPGTTGNSYSEGDTFSTADSTVGIAQNYSLAVYPECRESLKEEVVETANKLEELSDDVTNITSTIELTDFKTPKYTEIQDKTGFVGRWFDTELNGVPVKATINEGSEFYFKVKNTTTINVNFVLNSVQATPYFAYSIDGSPMTRQLITTSKLPAVTTDEHIVRVVIDGLTESEDKWLGEKGVAFKDVTVDAGGIVTGITPKNRKILFHGDSITEGVRVLNMNNDSTGNSATGAFPYIASNNLNSISYRVGFGASGITKGGSGGVPELIQVIDKMTNAREAPYIEPDVVVMNMGTNDSSATTEVFTEKLNEVLDRFSIKYSGTPIFIMVPFNQAWKDELTSAVSARSNMYLVETEGWNITTTDGTHPNVAGGLVAGQKLANAIISVLGKSYFIE
ncbi:SGNH/GDSL hydrolase family protein [Lactiplantibacillus plantarum]